MEVVTAEMGVGVGGRDRLLLLVGGAALAGVLDRFRFFPPADPWLPRTSLVATGTSSPDDDDDVPVLLLLLVNAALVASANVFSLPLWW